MLRIHSKDMSSILSDLLLIIEDINLVKKGKNVVFAPDFSEVFALANPVLTNIEFRTFGDDNQVERGIAQSGALNRLFFSSDINTVLLPSYKLELQRWATRERESTNEEVAELAKKAAEEIKALTAQPQFLRIMNITNISDDLSKDVNSKEVLEYFENEAGNLVRLLDQTVDSPIATVKRIFENSGYRKTEEVIGKQIEHDDEVFSRWYTTLTRSRRTENKFQISNDALAVSQVFTNNSLDDDVILRIVTRSQTMRSAAQDEVNEWQNAGGNPIRHPRVFNFFQSLKLNELDEALQSAEGMIEAIRSFVNSLSNDFDTNIDEETVGDIEKIKEQWHAGSQIETTVTAAKSTNARYQNTKNPSRRTVFNFLNRVRDRSSLRAVLVDRVASLVSEIEQDYFSLGYSIHSISSRMDLYPSDVDVINDLDSTIFSSSAFHNPYYLRFRSEGIWSLGLQLRSLERFDIKHISNWLAKNTTVTDPLLTHEKLLLMAYMFTIINDWDLASHYVEASIHVVERKHKIDISEALFLKVLCLSRLRKDSDYEKALTLLEEVKLEKSARRITCEKSSLAFRFGERGVLHQLNAIKLAQKVLGNLSGLADRPLRILVRNNLAFFYLNERPKHKKARIYYNLLMEEIREDPLREEKLWPNVLDTKYWGKWVLDGKSLDKTEKNKLATQLQEIINIADSRHPWIKIVRSHEEEIRKDIS